MNSLPTQRPILSRSPRQTRDIARRIVESLTGKQNVLALHGELGSGKTCFVQGLALALGITQPVTSPTFTIVNEYRSGRIPLYHIDLYRLGSHDEVFGFGFEDYLEAEGITAIEWAERAAPLLPPSALHIDFALARGRGVRSITLTTERKSPPPHAPGG